jgi:hypothetical protein
MGLIGCPETSVNNYQSTARRANILRSYTEPESLKSFLFIIVTEQTVWWGGGFGAAATGSGVQEATERIFK